MKLIEKTKVKFSKSLNWQMDKFVIITTIIVVVATTMISILTAEKSVNNVMSNYISDLASSKGDMIERVIDAAGDRDTIFNTQLEDMLKNVQVKGMSSSYAYLVDGKGQMLYHPDNSKIGQPVENSVIKGIVTDLEAGRKVKNRTVEYKFKGAVKYAGYYVAHNKDFILVVSCDKSEVMKPIKSMAANLIIFGIIIAAIAGMTTFFLMGKKLSAVNSLSESMEKMGDLDLTEDDQTKSLATREDEFGLMGKTISKTAVSLRNTMEVIHSKAQGLTDAAKSLMDNADSMTQTADQVDKAVNDMAQGATSQAEETQAANSAVVEIGNMIAEISSEIDELSKISEQMTEAGNNAGTAVKNLNEINSRTEQAISNISESTKKTNESASKIQEAASLISDIAKQTNLLSLNASIEAARAGEHGKGFAVVAESIGDLASQSKNAADKINAIISTLADDSKQTMAIMEDVTEVIKKQSDEIRKTSQAFDGIKEGITASVQAVQNISDKTAEINTSKAAIIDTLDSLSSIAEKNAAGTEESSASVTQLAEAMDNIRVQSNEVKETADDLTAEVKKFRL